MIIPNIWKNKKCSKPPISKKNSRFEHVGTIIILIASSQPSVRDGAAALAQPWTPGSRSRLPPGPGILPLISGWTFIFISKSTKPAFQLVKSQCLLLRNRIFFRRLTSIFSINPLISYVSKKCWSRMINTTCSSFFPQICCYRSLPASPHRLQALWLQRSNHHCGPSCTRCTALWRRCGMAATPAMGIFEIWRSGNRWNTLPPTQCRFNQKSHQYIMIWMIWVCAYQCRTPNIYC